LPVGSGSVAFSRDVTSIASIRGRLGFTVTPNVLLYATGGGAWARTSYSGLNQFAAGCPNCVSFAYSNTAGGWVAGAGVEWAATNNWLLRIEYLHYGFQGSTSPVAFFAPAFTFPGAQYTFDRFQVDELRVGVSYKFNSAGPVFAKD
jgi:outer membrane immunogenic protein